LRPQGGLSYFSSSGFSDSLPSKVKVFENRAKFMPGFFRTQESRFKLLQDMHIEKVSTKLVG
jgi:hypothetical protein